MQHMWREEEDGGRGCHWNNLLAHTHQGATTSNTTNSENDLRTVE